MGNSPSHQNDGPDGAGASEPRSRPALSTRGLSHRITGGGSNNNAQIRLHSISHLSLPSSLPSPFRTGGTLGLSRAELDERCKPSGLYPTCEWEPKQIRRLISNGLLAARLRGTDSRLAKTDRECPICFMYYSEANVSKCCNAILCTECYLQIKPGKDRHCICPFCNNPKMTVTVAKGMDEGDVAKREEEEQRVIEATIRSRISELHGESPAPSEGGGGGQPNSEETESEGSFGSSLAEYNRARTFSSASNGSGVGGTGAGDPAGPGTPVRHVESGDDSDSSQLAALAMTPEARRALESEMRAQLSHETHMRMENEAEEARMRHTQEWYGSHRGSRARMREARLAELTGMLERMSARGGVGAGAVGGGDENARGGGGPLMAGRGDGTDGLSARGGVAIRGSRGAGLSRLLRAMEGGGGRNLEDLMRLEAAFFLGMDDPTRGGDGASRGTSPLSRGRYSRNEDDEDDSDDDNEAGGRDGVRGQEPIRPIPPFALGPLPGSRRTVHRSRGGRSGGGRGVSTTHLDTAELLMQGVSEEEQLAMAIAMSMQDEQQRRQQQQQEEDGHGATISEGRGEGGRQPLDARPMGEEGGDGSSSDSSSSDSSEEGTGEGGVGNRGDTNAESLGGNGTVSLDEDEEEVVFAEV